MKETKQDISLQKRKIMKRKNINKPNKNEETGCEQNDKFDEFNFSPGFPL